MVEYTDMTSVSERESEVLLKAIDKGFLRRQYDTNGGIFLNKDGIVRVSNIIEILFKGKSRDEITDLVSEVNELEDSDYDLFELYIEDEFLNRGITFLELTWFMRIAYPDLFTIDADKLDYYWDRLNSYDDKDDLPVLTVEGVVDADASISEFLHINEYLESVKRRASGIPVSLIVRLVILKSFDVDWLNPDVLNPLGEVSRLEVAYLLSDLNLI